MTIKTVITMGPPTMGWLFERGTLTLFVAHGEPQKMFESLRQSTIEAMLVLSAAPLDEQEDRLTQALNKYGPSLIYRRQDSPLCKVHEKAALVIDILGRK